MVPEYSVVESRETLHMVNGLHLSNTVLDYLQVEVELALLSKELTMSVDILGKIRDSVHVLEQSLREQR